MPAKPVWIILLLSALLGGQDLQPRVRAAVQACLPRVVAHRRDFHAHPELSNRELRTSGRVAGALRELGLEVRTGLARHGVVGLLRGGAPGPVVAVRADMDALPIAESTRLPFASTQAGVMHACGHDGHMAIALGTAEVLAGLRRELRGSVLFLFQPSEEGPPAGERGGAELMIAEGALREPAPEAIYGLHVTPALEAGRAGFVPGPAMAAIDRFRIVIRGRMSHGAMPHKGVDAVVVAAECVLALQTVRSRRVDPIQPVILSIGTVQGGSRDNITAGEVHLAGTLRTLDEGVRAQAKAAMHELLGGVTAAHGASFDLHFGEAAPAVFNDPALADSASASLRKALGSAAVSRVAPWLVSEDFACYQKVIPGFFFFLGVAEPSKGTPAGLHTPDFDLDERALGVGVEAMTTLVLDHLDRAAPAGSRRR